MSFEGPSKIEVLTEEEIVNQIIEKASIRKRRRPDEKFNLNAVLRYGSKNLEVIIDGPNGQIETVIQRVGDGDEREPKETTLLYKAAKKLMEDFATEHGVSLVYLFQTNMDRMHAWAQKEGRNVFDWDNISEPIKFTDRDQPAESRTYSKTISPRKTK